MASNGAGDAVAPQATRGGFSSFPAPRPRQSDAEHLVSLQSRRPSQASAFTGGSQAASVTSKQSSASMYQSAMMQQPVGKSQNGTRRMQSQYPADEANRHVEFILVAAFDIDRGSIMEHQYPGPISGDENMLAELMLPDQMHSRSQDWTVFFLHKDSDEEGDDSDSPTGGSVSQSHGSSTDLSAHGQDSGMAEDSQDAEDAEDALENAPLIYVLNHVNTKHDKTVER